MRVFEIKNAKLGVVGVDRSGEDGKAFEGYVVERAQYEVLKMI